MALIEFCGLPGSGKSTVNRLLLGRLRAERDDVIDRHLADEEILTRYVGRESIATAAEAFKYGVCRPSWAWTAMGVLGRSPSRRTIRSVIRIQNQLRLSLALGSTHQLVVDEWVIHQGWLATLESPRVRVADIQRILRGVSESLATVPRLLVRLTVLPAVAAARVLSRPEQTWFQQLQQPDLTQMFERASASLDVLCETACEGGARTVNVDTTDAEPSEIADELFPQLKGFR
jgi:hypothetical protein